MNEKNIKRAIWIGLSCLFVFLFGNRIIDQVSLTYHTSGLNIDSLSLMNNTIANEIRGRKILIEKLDSDPSLLFLETTRKLNMADIKLIYAGTQNGQGLNQKITYRNLGSSESYMLMYEASYVKSIQVINSLEKLKEMRKIKSVIIEPSELGLLYTRLEIAHE